MIATKVIFVAFLVCLAALRLELFGDLTLKRTLMIKGKN